MKAISERGERTMNMACALHVDPLHARGLTGEPPLPHEDLYVTPAGSWRAVLLQGDEDTAREVEYEELARLQGGLRWLGVTRAQQGAQQVPHDLSVRAQNDWHC